ncbi:cyclin-A3-2, partial [Cajanus cajan]
MANAENNTHSSSSSEICDHLRPYKKRRYVLHGFTNVATSKKSVLQFQKPVPMLKNPRPLRDRCVSDIYEYLRWIEIDPTRAPSPNYIEKVQCDISAYTRAIVVGWLVEKTDKYELVSDVLYSSVAYLDRFLSFNNTPIDKMLLLGLSSLLVASKYEDRRALTIEDLRYIAGYSCSNQEVVNMEADILKVLKFELGSPTVNTFLTRFVTVGQEDID